MSEFDFLFTDKPIQSEVQIPLTSTTRQAKKQLITDLQKRSLTELIPTLPPPRYGYVDYYQRFRRYNAS